MPKSRKFEWIEIDVTEKYPQSTVELPKLSDNLAPVPEPYNQFPWPVGYVPLVTKKMAR